MMHRANPTCNASAMQTRRRLTGALVVLIAAAGCGRANTTTLDATPIADLEPAPTTSTTLSAEQVKYLTIQAQLAESQRVFLQGVADARSAVPAQLRRIMWCEAGSYVSLPRWETNYAAMTHGYDGASGGAQIVGSTWLVWAREVGVDVTRWPRAFVAPDFVQDVVATHGYRTRGTAPWRASVGCWS